MAIVATALALIAGGAAATIGYTNRGPGDPASVAEQAVAALTARNAAGLTAIECTDRRTGAPLASLPAATLQLIVTTSSDGPTALVTDFQARKPVTINAKTSESGEPQRLPSEIVLEVESHRWCVAGLAQRTTP